MGAVLKTGLVMDVGVSMVLDRLVRNTDLYLMFYGAVMTGDLKTNGGAADGLVAIADGVHVVEGQQTVLGLEFGARMTVLECDAGVLVHSPLAVDPGVLSSVGAPRWVLAPNLLHHLYVGPWLQQGVEGWAAPGLAEKRKDLHFHKTIEGESQPFGSDLRLFALSCFPLSNEVVVLHRPSRTLVVTDLVFNLAPSMPWSTRTAMRCIGGYPGCCSTLLERALMHREAARREIGALLELDFDRLIMSHGEVIETGGREALRGAFSWLGL